MGGMRGWIGLLVLIVACSPAAGGAPSAVVEVRPVAGSDAGGATDIEAGPRPVTLPPMQAAERLLAEGRAYAQRGEHAAALNRFETAYRISPSDESLYSIGQTLEDMGRRGEAAEIYEKLLQGDLSPMDRMSMELRIQQLRGAR